MTTNFVLYHTDGCHLCELAEAVIRNVAAHYPITWTIKDIADDDELIEAYGVRIPVLLNASANKELGWPFDEQALFEWLSAGESNHCPPKY